MKYGAKGKVFEKIYLSKEGGVRRLRWNDMYSDWSDWLKGKGLEELNVKLDTFRIHVQQEYNVGFKIPRSDQCNICRRHEIELQNEKDRNKRSILEENLKEHQCDASDVRDFIYNAFQETREQLGKLFSFYIHRRMAKTTLL